MRWQHLWGVLEGKWKTFLRVAFKNQGGRWNSGDFCRCPFHCVQGWLSKFYGKNATAKQNLVQIQDYRFYEGALLKVCDCTPGTQQNEGTRKELTGQPLWDTEDGNWAHLYYAQHGFPLLLTSVGYIPQWQRWDFSHSSLRGLMENFDLYQNMKNHQNVFLFVCFFKNIVILKGIY